MMKGNNKNIQRSEKFLRSIGVKSIIPQKVYPVDLSVPKKSENKMFLKFIKNIIGSE